VRRGPSAAPRGIALRNGRGASGSDLRGSLLGRPVAGIREPNRKRAAEAGRGGACRWPQQLQECEKIREPQTVKPRTIHQTLSALHRKRFAFHERHDRAVSVSRE
jgi:hypothetical protein